jgi:transposase
MTTTIELAANAFTRTDRRRLAQALAATRLAREYRRLEAVLLVAEGRSLSESARHVRVARSSVQRWVRHYLANRDAAALVDRPRTGRPRAARQLTEPRLAAALRRDPRRLGYRSTTWTVALLARYCVEHLHCAITPRTLRRRLRERGYRWKRPRYLYTERAAHLAQKKGLSDVA